MKKFFMVIAVVLLCVLVLFSFSGCKSTAATETKAVAEETSATETTEKLIQEEDISDITEGAATGEQVTIKFLHWRSENRAAWEEFITLFEEKYPNIKVEMEITTSNIDLVS